MRHLLAIAGCACCLLFAGCADSDSTSSETTEVKESSSETVETLPDDIKVEDFFSTDCVNGDDQFDAIYGTTSANYSGCDLTGEIGEEMLSQRSLEGLALGRANLSGLDLTGQDLSNSDLCEADLTGANLYGANFTESNLSGCEADRPGANLTGANLSYANFTEANLGLADLTGADLTGAIWSDTTCPNLEDVQGENGQQVPCTAAK